MNKIFLWVGIAASIATIAGFINELTKPAPVVTKKESSSSPNNNANGISIFGSVEQKQTIQVNQISQPSNVKVEAEAIEIVRNLIVKHDSTYSIASISQIINQDISGFGSDSSCSKFSLSTTIVKRTYDENNPVRIGGLIVVTKWNERGFIGLDETLYDRLSRVDASLLDSFLSENQKVVIDGFKCGLSAIQVWEADAIRLSPARRSTEPAQKAAQAS